MNESLRSPGLREPLFHLLPDIAHRWAASDECPPHVREEIDMVRALAEQESPAGERLIARGLDLAIAGHQLNPNKKKRDRKYIPPGQSLPDPYLIHLLEATLPSLGAPNRLEEYDDTRQLHVLESVQDPYHAVVATAILLHDVPEDSGGIDGVIRVAEPKDWQHIVKPYLLRGPGLRGDEVPREWADSVWRIMYAETNPTGDELEKLRREIIKSPFVKNIASYLRERASGRHPTDAIEHQLADTIAARHTLLTRTAGYPFERLAALNGKTADRSHNMKSPGTNYAKLYDAYATLEWARTLGLRSASEGMFGLAKNAFSTGDDPGSPYMSRKERLARLNYIDFENDRNLRKEKGLPMPEVHITPPGARRELSFPIASNQLPITTLAERRAHPSDPAVQFAVRVDNHELLRALAATPRMGIRHDTEGAVLEGVQYDTPLMGRLREYQGIAIFAVAPPGTNNTAFYVRFEDTQPTGHDVLKRGSTEDAANVPGMKLLSRADGSVRTTLEICEELSPLAV